MPSPYCLSASIERWPVRGSFVISRGAKTYVDVVMCKISDGNHTGLGEATPIYYQGETAEIVVQAIKAVSYTHLTLPTICSV